MNAQQTHCEAQPACTICHAGWDEPCAADCTCASCLAPYRAANHQDAEALLRAANIARHRGEHGIADRLVTWATQARGAAA